ncbi:electron transfer flavoprotein subunit alpha, partial [Clostridium sp. ZC22-4]|nr:electron transfer flavoprotein subunit alpha [Clostridium brassicae]MCY6959019.1 electron transfer flavoprotein subunit alpha [Clostridium brassicae]
NRDADAAIMKVADLGIVGDVTKVIPELVAQVKSYK